MKIPGIILFPILFLISLNLANAQGEKRFWYFGNGCGLDFNTSPPVAITNGALNAFEGCASISDPNGVLQFYTDGKTVWNRNHIPMPSGNGLNGDGAATQTAIIVPAPLNLNLYYIFTVDTNGGPRGLNYSEVDMTLNGGLGDVTVKNVQLQTPVTEKLTAVRHANNIDAWVVVHGWNSDIFYAYEITSAGINLTPVTSATGSVHTGTYLNSHGYMKASADGNKIACAIRGLSLGELFTFNNITGQVSNPVSLPMPGQVYGVEFSPDSRYLYIATAGNPATIHQFDSQAGNIPGSGQIITNYPGFIGAMQLGPDDKIYICQFQSQNLAIIDQPNIAGPGCNFTANSIFLGGATTGYGLPNFLQSFFINADFIYADTCSNQPAQFEVVFNNPDSVFWNFDDPGSGTSNTSTQVNTTHIFSTPGPYDVQLIVWQNLLSDTIIKTITILETPDPDLGNDISACDGETVTLDPGTFPGNYLWQDGNTGITYDITASGEYHVTIDNNGCTGQDTLQAVFNPSPDLDLGTDIQTCEGTVTLIEPGIPGNYIWNDGSTNTSFTATVTGTYAVTVTENGCSSTDDIFIEFLPAPQVHFGNDTTICTGFTLFLDATNTGSTYLWQDGSVAPAQFVTNGGLYHVLVTNGSCTATDTIFIDEISAPNTFLGEDTLLCAGQPIILDAYHYGSNYVWQDGSTDSVLIPQVTGQYYVTVSNQCGFDADSIEVTLLACECKVFIPTAFSPNLDNKNEIYNFRYNCTEFQSELSIYNRIGQLVFQSKDPDFGWDGNFQDKPATEGIYLYELKYSGFESGAYLEETRRGVISLVR